MAAPSSTRARRNAGSVLSAPEAASAQASQIGGATCSLRKMPETTATISMPLIAAASRAPL